MVIFAAAAAAAAAGTFSWNREGFFFERELQQKRDYQGQEMQIRQFELYREDIKDLVQLTVRKMDNYLLVNTLQLGFCITLFTDGRPKRDEESAGHMAPTWLIGLYAMCNAGAFLYYLLSIWLAMHASISAHSFGVRILTQCVRLPVPDKAQLDQSAARATDFENMNFRDVLRIPLWRQQLNNLSRAMNEASNDGEADHEGDSASGAPEAEMQSIHPVTKLGHVILFRKLQANWQAYDAYARICMAMGTNQILQALSYESLILLNAENDDRWPSIVCVAVFTCCAWIIAKLDLWLSRNILFLTAVLLILPPACAAILLEVESNDAVFLKDICGVAHKVLVPLVYALHVLWIWFTCRIAEASSYNGVKLPTAFRSVLYLDVFNWLNDQPVNPVVEAEAYPQSQRTQRQDPLRQELPAHLRVVLDENCRRGRRVLEADLRRWAHPQVQAWLSESSEAKEVLRMTRALFDEVAQQLDAAPPPPPPRETQATSSADEEGPVFLRLEYNPGDMFMYWYNVEAGEVKWEVPRQGRISDVDGLRKDVEEFGQQVGTLLGRPLDGPQALPPPTGSSSSRGSPAVPRGRPEVAHAAAGPPGQAFTAPAPPGPGSGAASATLPRARVSAKPGELPWDTVHRGSVALMFAWFLGVVWTAISYWFGVRIPFHDDDTGMYECNHPTRSLSKVSLDAIGSGTSGGLGAWPAALLQPEGLACDEGLDGVLLFAGKYVVQVVAVGLGGGEPSRAHLKLATDLHARLDACLLAAPQFHGKGFLGVSLDCPSARPSDGTVSSCDALLLGVEGREVLRCSLAALAADASRDPVPRITELRGGPWRSLVADSSNGSMVALSQDGAALVALGPDGSGSSDVLRPHHSALVCEAEAGRGPCSHAALKRRGPLAAAALHRHGPSGQLLMIGVGPGSEGTHLGAVPLEPSGSSDVRRWRRLHTSVAHKASLARTAWRGMCRNGQGLWLLGDTSRRSGGEDIHDASLWSLPLW